MGTLVEIRAPENSEGTRSQVQRWLKSIGDAVEADEPLIEVETDKVTIEIPAPAAGVLRQIAKTEQEEIAPGDVLGSIETGAVADVHPVAKSAIEHAPRQTTETEAVRANASAPSAEPARRAVSAVTEAALTAHAAVLTAPRLSPAVRRLLEQHGLKASSIRGSGEGGRVTVDDVLAYVSQVKASTPAPVAEPNRQVRRAPHSMVRKRIAERMVESLLHTAPHVTTVFEADMSAVLAHRAAHREEFEGRGAQLTLTAYFLAACVDAILEVPEANSRWTADALEIYETIDIGVGTAVEGKGLLVPVVRNVHTLDLFGIARALADVVARARADKLTAEDMRGGTFTISNHGVSGSLVATPIIINQPQSAILGVGKLEKRAVVVSENGEDRVVVRPRCFITLTIDHRVMDGHRANRFLEVLVRRLETWS
jgi:2-oxoglutarate dehydrogenase E2 component (dihydrolipoamide succinyltransferase)